MARWNNFRLFIFILLCHLETLDILLLKSKNVRNICSKKASGDLLAISSCSIDILQTISSNLFAFTCKLRSRLLLPPTLYYILDSIKTEFTNLVKHTFVITKVKVRCYLEITSFGIDGVDVIKDAFNKSNMQKWISVRYNYLSE